MRRQDKFPDTEYFHWHNQNPHNRLTTDCVIRAISTALEIPYNTVLMELAEQQVKTGFDDGDPIAYSRYLKSKGWVKLPQPRRTDGTKFTGKDFLTEVVQTDRPMLAHIGGHHIVAIVNRKVWDTWDSTDKCIGNVWVEEGSIMMREPLKP